MKPSRRLLQRARANHCVLHSDRFIVAAAVALSLLFIGAVKAQDRLEKSPRHQEWVQVKSGERTVHCFVVYPEVKDKAPAVLIIHENMGLTDWVRGVADQLAEAGYVAVAPDLLSGMAPGGGRTKDFADVNAAREAIYALKTEQVAADLSAAADYACKLPACNGKLAVAGFCWGGSTTFQFATQRKDLAAAFVFYGTAPTQEADLSKITCPVFGFYAGNDARVSATVGATKESMKKLDKTYEPVTYEGAGHGFMRAGEEPGASNANRKARDEAWNVWKEGLRKAFAGFRPKDAPPKAEKH